jgi:hypothetical protein
MEPQTEPVCVVIADATVDEDELRQYLHLSLPVSVTRWEQRQYYATINHLRPCLVIVVSATDQVAQESAALIASLITTVAPTVACLALTTLRLSDPHVIVQQLGSGATARIASLADLRPTR